MLSIRLGIRNLLRNRWRTGLTCAGIAVAVGLLVWTIAFYDGWIGTMVRGATAVESGQVQIQTAGWVESPRLYMSFDFDETFDERLRSVPDVEAVAPRVEVFGLIGNEDRSRVARILGVDPELERAATPVPDAVQSGRWLSAEAGDPFGPREVVLGADLARNLRIDLGAELVIFFEAADGSLGNDLVVVVGTVRTGNTAVDRTVAYLRLEDAQEIAALEGQVNRVLVRTAELTAARESAAVIAESLGARLGAPADGEVVPDETIVVRPWQEIHPGIAQMLLLVRRSNWFVYLIVYLVAAVGILNAQRMSAVERRREFGVMMALGVRPKKMFRILQVETVTLGVVGAAAGALLGFLLSWYHATAGFDLTLLTDQANFSYMGVAFNERIFFELTPFSVVQPFVVMLGVALLSGLWPAATAARIDPAPTIAGRT